MKTGVAAGRNPRVVHSASVANRVSSHVGPAVQGSGGGDDAESTRKSGSTGTRLLPRSFSAETMPALPHTEGPPDASGVDKNPSHLNRSRGNMKGKMSQRRGGNEPDEHVRLPQIGRP